MREDVVLLAASGLAREVSAAIDVGSTSRVVGLLDDDAALHGKLIGHAPVLGSIEDATKYPNAKFVVCAGSGQARLAIVARLAEVGIGRDRYVPVVHPSVAIPDGCRLGVGSVLLAQVVLTADVTIGDHVLAMPHSVMTHDAVVEDFVTLCSGVLLGGAVRVGRAAYLGMGSSVREGVRVGESGVLGMGATLLVDLPRNEVWIGVPAKRLPSSGPGNRHSTVRTDAEAGIRG